MPLIIVSVFVGYLAFRLAELVIFSTFWVLVYVKISALLSTSTPAETPPTQPPLSPLLLYPALFSFLTVRFSISAYGSGLCLYCVCFSCFSVYLSRCSIFYFLLYFCSTLYLHLLRACFYVLYLLFVCVSLFYHFVCAFNTEEEKEKEQI